LDFNNKLESLYLQLPQVNCICCGGCCVSPTCTLIEFVYLIRTSIETLGSTKIKELVLSRPSLHPDYEGNIHCIFLENRKCSVHTGRTGACRLFGIPSLSQLGVEDLVECKNNITTNGLSSIEFISEWLENLFTLNCRYYPYGEEPYHIKGLNLSCWFDIFFDETINFEPFMSIKRFLRENLDLGFINGDYKQSTGIKEKIDKISLLSMLLDSGDPQTLKSLLLSIRDDYPLTGTYFYEESNAYLNAIDSIIKT